jgi:hypothetical protein
MSQQHDDIDRAIARVREDVLQNRPEKSLAAPADPYDIREFGRDQMKEAADRPDVWNAVMEYHDFRWYEPKELDDHLGLQKYIPAKLEGVKDQLGRDLPNSHLWLERPHPEGQWRNDFHRPRFPEELKMAFTLQDLITGYGSPEVWDSWYRGQVTQYRMNRLGLVSPK